MTDMFGLHSPLPETPEAAKLEIDSIFANKEHPYHTKPGHPLRDLATERVGKLFKIRSGEVSVSEQTEEPEKNSDYNNRVKEEILARN